MKGESLVMNPPKFTPRPDPDWERLRKLLRWSPSSSPKELLEAEGSGWVGEAICERLDHANEVNREILRMLVRIEKRGQ